MSIKFRILIALLIVGGNFGFSIVRANFRTFDPTLEREPQFADADTYINQYFGESSRAPYRVLTPVLARLIPDPPLFLFGVNRHPNPITLAGFKFAIVNYVFLLLTGLVLYELSLGFGLSASWSGLTAVLLFSLTQVVGSGGGPVVDTSYWFFLALAAWMVQRQRAGWLALVMLIGVFAKEQVLWILLLILIAPFEPRTRVKLFVSVMPAFIIYWAIRWWFAQTMGDSYLSGRFVSSIPSAMMNLFTLQALKELVMTFGTIWVPAGYALLNRQAPKLLIRWIWLVPAILVGNRLLGVGAPGVLRHLTVSFFVVIPLAVFGLRHWLTPSMYTESAKFPTQNVMGK